MSKHRHVTCHFHVTCNGWCNRDVRIYNLYGLKAHSNVLSNNLCHVHLTISKIGCHRLTQQCWHACTNEILEIWKLHILWHNFIKCAQDFSSNLENRHSLIQIILMRGKTLAHIKTTHVWNLVQIKKVEYLT